MPASCEGLWRRIPYPLDDKRWSVRDSHSLRVCIPFRETAGHGRNKPCVSASILDAYSRPGLQGFGDCVSVMRDTTKKAKHAVSVMRKVGVQAHPAAVAALEKTEYRVNWLGTRTPVETEIPFAAKEDGGIAHVDGDLLLLAGSKAINFGRHESARRDRCLCCRSYAKGRWKSRFGAGQQDRAAGLRREPGKRPELCQCVLSAQHLQASPI
jgi:hypothetical protein